MAGEAIDDALRPLQLRTSRLDLIAATADTVALELRDVAAFATAIGVPVPAQWPAPLNDEDSQRWYLDMLQRDPRSVGWALWYVVRREPQRELIGVVGFKGRPDDGECEIGYSLLPAFHGHGYATEAARALIGWAFAREDVARVTAETLADLVDSIRVIEKCAMMFVGRGSEEAGQPTVRYAVTRAAFHGADEQSSSRRSR
ncbi:MAG TPA: GNAT family N-acetyltransferase [Vicinamibacterales bacterium]|nr:GNAT family N-acetyltransferase [Vicinamibacterales bacterium]